MMLPPISNYVTERAILLECLGRWNADIEHIKHPLLGPAGEVLYTDVGRLGPPIGEASAVVIIASGTHGVEGHGGSVLQSYLFEANVLGPTLRDLPPGVAVVFVHAINPYGMAWDRRVDHENVDVNRNFVDFSAPLPVNELYDSVDSLLNPKDLDLDDVSWLEEAAAFEQEVGTTELFRTVSGGQYHNADGVQYGGQRPTWSSRTVHEIWARQCEGAKTVINLDIHTGLGPSGVLTVFQTADVDEPAAKLAADWFPNVWRSDREPEDGTMSTGLLGPALDAALPEADLTMTLVIEFGTRDAFTVFAAMRADNWLHNQGAPLSDDGDRVRAMMRHAFAQDDDDWRRAVAEQGVAAVEKAIEGAAAQVGA